MEFTNKPRGVISIVALILFSLLMLFGIMVHLIITDTYKIISNTNNYFDARDITSSVSEYLKNEIKDNNEVSGFNLGPIYCDNEGNEDCLFDFDELANGKELSLEFYIEARHTTAPYLIPADAFNQLTFGNTVVDNVLIPLSYLNDSMIIQEPFFGETGALEELELEINVPSSYTLKEDPTRPLVEIIIEGKCADAYCAYKLNKAITSTEIEDLDSSIFDQDSQFFDLNSFNGTNYAEANLSTYLSGLNNPILKIRLIDQLKDDDDNLVPYLEYRFTTSVPVSYPAYQIYIKATVDKNTYIRKEEVDYPRNLLDAAIS